MVSLEKRLLDCIPHPAYSCSSYEPWAHQHITLAVQTIKMYLQQAENLLTLGLLLLLIKPTNINEPKKQYSASQPAMLNCFIYHNVNVWNFQNLQVFSNKKWLLWISSAFTDNILLVAEEFNWQNTIDEIL